MLDDHKCHAVANLHISVFKDVPLCFKAIFPTYMKHNIQCQVRKTSFSMYLEGKCVGQHDF